MTLRSHVIQATVGSAILAPFLGAKTIFFFVSMILIDVDHYFTYIVVCRRFDIRGLFQFYDFIFKNKESVYGFCLFHTAEGFLLLFIVSLCVHILIWRRRHPKSHAVALLLIFIIVPVIIGMADWFAYRFLSKGFISVSIFNWLLILLLHFSLAAAYILSYPALQAVSPSLAML